MSHLKNIDFKELKQLAAGELSDKRSAELMKIVENDENLMRLYQGILDFQTNENESIEDYVLRAKAGTKFEEKKRVKLISNKKAYALVSSIAAVLLIGFFAFNWWQSQPQRLDFKDAGLAVSLSVENNNLSEAMNNYKTGKLDLAAEQIDNLLLHDPNNDTLIYYRAVIHKMQGEYNQALSQFKAVDEGFKAKVDFQIAIVYWYMGDKEQAINSFEHIVAQPSHPFLDKSIKALARLD